MTGDLRRRLTVAVATTWWVPLVAGCAGLAPDPARAADVAAAFSQAVADGDGGAACDLLAPRTFEALADEGQSCDEAVLEAGLSTEAMAVEDARAYGRQAQVELDSDVMFLTRDGSAWLVTAAGCTERPDRPYDCLVEGS